MDGGFKPGARGERPGFVQVLSGNGSDPERGSFQMKGGYFQAPDLIFDLPLTANEKLVLIYFMRRADRQGKSFPSIQRICRDCGFRAENTVRKAIKGLVKAGLIRKRPVCGRPHYYTVSKELYEVIQRAGRSYKKRKEREAGAAGCEGLYENGAPSVEGGKHSSTTPSNYEGPPSNNEPPPLQNLTPKEYTYKENTTKEDTVKEEKRKKRALEEAGASSSISSPVDDDEVTMLDVAEHLHALSPREQKEFDKEARKLMRPGEPEPEGNLWQTRLLRVRYLQQLKERGGCN